MTMTRSISYAIQPTLKFDRLARLRDLIPVTSFPYVTDTSSVQKGSLFTELNPDIKWSVGSSLVRGKAGDDSSAVAAEDPPSSSNATIATADKFAKDFVLDLATALRREPIEPGRESAADVVLEKAINIDKPCALMALTDYFLKNIDRPSVAADVLTILGRLPYKSAYPSGTALVLLGISHKSPAVQEASIRAIENWRDADSVRLLRQLTPTAKWLQSYRDAVLKEVEAES